VLSVELLLDGLAKTRNGLDGNNCAETARVASQQIMNAIAPFMAIL
jgi:hypothetical protein